MRTWNTQEIFYPNSLSERPTVANFIELNHLHTTQLTVENLESRRSRWEEESEIELNHFAQDRRKRPVFDVVYNVYVIKVYES